MSGCTGLLGDVAVYFLCGVVQSKKIDRDAFPGSGGSFQTIYTMNPTKGPTRNNTPQKIGPRPDIVYFQVICFIATKLYPSKAIVLAPIMRYANQKVMGTPFYNT